MNVVLPEGDLRVCVKEGAGNRNGIQMVVKDYRLESRAKMANTEGEYISLQSRLDVTCVTSSYD